jgi:hypothetical protein
VQKAKEIIERESSIPGTMEQRMKSGYQSGNVYGNPTLFTGISSGAGFGFVPAGSMMPGINPFQPSAADPSQATVNRVGGGLPVFQPKPTDTNRIMYNRPGQPPGGCLQQYNTTQHNNLYLSPKKKFATCI